MRRDLAIVPEGTTEDKLIELWVRLKKSEHTQRAYRHDIEMFRDVVEKPLVEVTLDFCDSLDELEITNKRGEKKPLEDNSRRRIINSVKSLYSFAYNSGLFPANVMAALGQECHLAAQLSEGTVLKMIILEQDPRNHAILHVLYAAGLRVSELCNLRWRHVIRRSNGVQLDIGTRLDATTIFRIVREAAKRAGVPNWYEVSPHWLRHCHGSHAIDHQAPLTVVRDTRGHRNIAVTNEYAKARPDQSSSGYLPLS